MELAIQNNRARQCRRIGDVDVDVETVEGAIGRLVSAIGERRPGIWAFCNAHTINVAASNGQFRKAAQRITMFNDGVGIDIASQWLYGKTFPENLNGTDLSPGLLTALPSGSSVFLVGGQADVVREAADVIAATFPHMRVAGYQHGYFDASERHELVKRIAQTDAGFVIVGMGQPRQEIWADACVDELNIPILCVGAQIDRFAGRIPRAPLWIRRMKMEWLFRLLLEPRRLAGRYLWGNFVFLVRLFFARRNARRRG